MGSGFQPKARIHAATDVTVSVRVRCPICELEWDLKTGNIRCSKGHVYPDAEKILQEKNEKE
jgi:hypothetical protein